MNKKRLLLLLCFVFLGKLSIAQITSIQTGDWDDGSTWVGGVVPTAGNDAVIADGHTVTLPKGNTAIINITINSGGILSHGGGNIDLTVNGNFINNGTETGGNAGAVLYLNGTNKNIDGTGTVSNSGGVEINSGDKTILATANITFSDEFTIDNGITVTNNGTVTISNGLTGGGATATWVNGSSSTLNVGNVLLSTGILTASAGNNTIVYNMAGAQDVKIPSSSYYNLSLSGSNTKSLVGSVDLNGNLTISSTLDVSASNFNINLAGNWVNTGTFTKRAGTVVLDGSGVQSISNAVGETFCNLTINKSSETVTLNNATTVSNALTMTSGNIDASSSTLTLGTGTGNEGTLSHSSGVIVGNFERWINTTATDFLFPIGISANFCPMTVYFNVIGIGGSLIGSFVETSPGINGLPLFDDPDSIINPFTEGYWDFTPANSFASGNFNLKLEGDGFYSFTMNSATRLLTRDNSGSNWTANGTHVSAIGDTAIRNAITTLPAQFAFGDSTDCEIPNIGSISGDDSVCTSTSGKAYSVTNTLGSTYEWIITGGSVASGQGNNSITVDWGATASSSANVRVIETNYCSRSAAEDLPIVIHTLSTSSITGQSSVVMNSEGDAYSVTNTDGYTYTWTITGGSQASGTTTNSITVDWGSSGTGNVRVIASTGCGASAAVDLATTISGTITSIASGSWSTDGTWDCDCEPSSGDNVVIEAGHTVTLPNGGARSIAGMTINAAGELADNNKSFTVSGSFIVNGTYSGSNTLTLSGSDKNIGGTGTISNTGGITISGGGKTILSSATFTKSSGDVTLASGITITNNGAITLGGSVIGTDGASSWTNAANATLNIGGTLLATGILTANSSGNTINYNGTIAQNVKNPTSSTYHNLTLGGSNTKTLLATTTVAGDLTISSTFDVSASNYNINLAGNWINTGTFTEQSGTVTINGTSAQSITNTAAETFYTFIINKTSNTLTLNDNVTASNGLTITDGDIATGNNKLILGTGIGNEGTLAYTAGIVVGNFERWMNTGSNPYLFPIGVSGSYRPATITFTNITGGTIIAAFTETNPGISGLTLDDGGTNIYNSFTEGFWDLTAANSLASTNYDLELTGTDFSSFTVASGTRLMKRADAGSDWTADGSHAAASGSTAKRTAMSGFSQFAFGDITACDPPTTSAMSGDDSVCVSVSGKAYSVTDHTNSSYVWVITGGTQASGGTTNSITVDWGATGKEGSVKVVETDNCGSADTVTKSVNIHALPTSVIDGKIQVLEYDVESYSVTNIDGYSYAWVITGGAQASGGTSNSITVNWGAEGAGKVQVVASCGCGAADISELDITLIYTAVKSTGSGNWNNTGTWDCACIPSNSQSVTIDSGHVVTLDITDTTMFFTVHATAELNSSSNTLVVTGDYKVNGIHSGSGNTVLSGSGTVIDGIGTISNTGDLQIIDGDKTIFSGAAFTKASGVFSIASGITVTNNGSITFGGNITGAAGSSTWTNGENATLNIGGALLSTGTLNASNTGNTINYNGSSAQDIKNPASSYYHLSATGSNTKTLTAATDVNGNITISSTLDVSGSNYAISLAGNWANTGAFNERSGTVTIDGTAAQSITNTSGETFYNLTTNKSSETLTLNDNVTVSNTLTMTSGNIDAATDKLILGTGTGNVGTLSRTSGTIIGLFERWINSTGVGITFPVGVASSYRPALITFTNLTGGSLIGKFVATNPGTSGLPIDDGAFSIDASFTEGYWSFDDANSLASTDYDLELTGTGFSSYSIVSATRMMKRASAVSDWTFDGTHVASSGSTAKREAMSGFSEFALGDTATCSGPSTSAIIGNDSVCASASGIAYSVTNTSGNTYTWTVLGGSLASGQGSNSIIINWGATARSDANVRVIETDACKNGDPIDLSTTIHTLSTSTVTGNNGVSEYSSGEAYSVTNNGGYTYTWTVLGGSGTIASGQGTNSITVNWLGQNTDTLSVTASTGCGSVDAEVLPVAIYGNITSVGTGNWGTAGTWSCSCIPTSTDNVIIANTHTVTLITNTTVNNLDIQNGGALNNNTYSLSVDGNYTIDGTHSGTGDINLNGASKTIYGSGSITNTGIFRIAEYNKIIASSANFTTSSGGELRILTGISVINNGIVTLGNDLVGAAASSTWINGEDATLKIVGTILSTGTLTPSGSGNTIEYNYNGAQSVKTTTGSGYYHLTLSTGGTKTLAGATDVNGTLTTAVGVTLDVSASNYSVNLAGNWENSGDFNERSGTMIFDGSSTQTINASGLTTETFNAMQINSGAEVSLPAGKQLTLNGNYTNNGAFYIKADASSMASFIDNGTISGSGKDSVECYLAGTIWHYFSQPVSSTNVNPLEEFHVKKYKEDAGSWENLVRNDEMERMRAYTTKYGSGSHTACIGGTVNTGSISYPLTYNAGVGDGWHLVGNPYPSAIDWNAGSGWTKTNVNGTIYFYDGTQYAIWNGTAGTNGGTQYIPAMQGVFIQCTSAGTIGVTNDVRVHNTQSYWKKKKKKKGTSIRNMLKLKTSRGTYRDEIVLQFISGASEGFDNNAEKWFSGKSYIPELYTMDSSGTKLAINVLPELTEDISLPLGFKTKQSGAYNIEAIDHSGFHPNTTILLEDLQENIIINIRDSSYSFTSNYYYGSSRFKLHFSPIVEVATELQDVFVCSSNEDISFSVISTGTDRQIQWQQYSSSGWTDILDGSDFNGSKKDTLKLMNNNSEMDSTLYRCYVSNNKGSDTSRTAVLRILTDAMFISASADFVVCEDNNAVFNVIASGGMTSYNWQEYINGNWLDISDGKNVSIDKNNLTIPNVDYSYNNKLYRCYTSNSCSSDTIVSTKLEVNKKHFTSIDTSFADGGGIYLANTYHNTEGVYNYTLKTVNHCDSVVQINLSKTTGIIDNSTKENKDIEILYDNTNITININNLSKYSDGNIRISNILGQELFYTPINKSTLIIPTKNFKNGIVFVGFNSSEYTVTKKLCASFD